MSRISLKIPINSPNPLVIQKRLPNGLKPKLEITSESPSISSDQSSLRQTRVPRVLISLRRCKSSDLPTFRKLLDQSVKSLGELLPVHVAEIIVIAASSSEPIPEDLIKALTRRHDLLSLAQVLAISDLYPRLPPATLSTLSTHFYTHLLDERSVDNLSFSQLRTLILAIDRSPVSGSLTDLTRRSIISSLNRHFRSVPSWELVPVVPSLLRLNWPQVDWRPLNRALEQTVVARLEIDDLALVQDIAQVLTTQGHSLAPRWRLFRDFCVSSSQRSSAQ